MNIHFDPSHRRGWFNRLTHITLLTALVLGLSALFGCKRITEPEEPEHAIRVVSWNIQWFPGRSPRATPEQQARHKSDVKKYLPRLRPDILLLQEIRNKDAAQFLVDCVPDLELHVVTAFMRAEEHLSQQIVIASRYPARAGFMEVFTDIYSDPEETPSRGFAFAALESPLGGTLLVYAVHLKSNLGEPDVNIAIREESARQILRHIAEMTEQYAEYGPISVLVGGDFNLLLERPHMAHERTLDQFTEQGFHWTWEGVPVEQRATWPAAGEFMDACFDHILTRDLPIATAEVMHKPADRYSDHRPVLLRLPLPVTEEEPVTGP